MTLEKFVDELRNCSLPDLRVNPTDEERGVLEGAGEGRTADTALVAFAPASDLPGW